MLSESQKEISVIIPHHTGVDLLRRCLDSVILSECVEYDTVVVTSDNHFDFDTWLKEYPSVNFWFEAGGPAHKRNWAVARTKSPYLVFLDDDVELSPYCIYELKKGLDEDQKRAMGFAKILNMERRDEFDDCASFFTRTGFLYARSGNNQKDTGQFDNRERCLASKSATCIITRSAFISAGGFDGAYFILGEETDLAWRCWLKGFEVWYLPQAKSWHAFGTSLKPKADYYTLERIHFHGCKNYLNLLVSNLGLSSLLFTLTIHLAVWIVSAVGFLIMGKPTRSYQILRGIWWNVTHLSSTLSKRRRVQKDRRITDRQLMKLVAYNPPLRYYLLRMWRYWTTQLHG